MTRDPRFDRIDAARIGRGLSVKSLCRRAGISRATWYAVAVGRFGFTSANVAALDGVIDRRWPDVTVPEVDGAYLRAQIAGYEWAWPLVAPPGCAMRPVHVGRWAAYTAGLADMPRIAAAIGTSKQAVSQSIEHVCLHADDPAIEAALDRLLIPSSRGRTAARSAPCRASA